MEEKEILDILKVKLDKRRYKHTISVADTAERISYKLINKLEYKNNFLIKKVRQAALLHDYAKNLNFRELMNFVDLAIVDWKIDAEELAIPQILHAPVSAYLANNELGIEDKEVLEAIRYHTIGSTEMGIVAQIVFTADFTEPNRRSAAANLVRNELNINGLESGIIKICDFLIKFNINRGLQLHPNTVLLRNAYLRRQK